MDVREFLQSRLNNNRLAENAKRLLAFEKKPQNAPLSKESIELGRIFLNDVAALRDDSSYVNTWEPFAEGTPRYQRVLEIRDMDAQKKGNFWENHHDLWVFFWGEETAKHIKTMCEMFPRLAYQEGYARRAYTAPNMTDMHFLRQTNTIIRLLNTLLYDLTMREYVLYDNHLGRYSSEVAALWAAAINDGNEEFYQLLLDVVYSRHDTARVSRDIIKALLLCNRPEAWEGVEKLLLAAQRQEGLRQTILECLDETNLEAMKRMIKLILDEKLTRFSSVVRALDVWAGLGWEAQRESTIIRFMEFAHRFLNNPDQIAAAIDSKDNGEIYMALWAQGVLDVEKTYPLIDRLVGKAETDKVLLALYFASTLALPAVIHKYAVACLPHSDKAVLAQALDLLSYYSNSLRDFLGENWKQVFETLEDRLKDAPEKEVIFEGKVFSWLNLYLNKQKVFQGMLTLLDLKEEAEQELILPYFDALSSDQRWAVVAEILPYDYEARRVPPLSTRQRDFALRVLKDRSSSIRDRALEALGSGEINEKEIDAFIDILSRKAGEVRKVVIGFLLKLEASALQNATLKLLKANAEQRLAGLDILTQTRKLKLVGEDWITETIENFAKNPKVTDQERLIIDKLLDKSVDVLAFAPENGFGLFSPANFSPTVPPALPTAESVYEKESAKYPQGLSKSREELAKALQALEELIFAHKDYEYEAEYWNGNMGTVLLGNSFQSSKYDHSNLAGEALFETYPLAHLWKQWAEENGLTPLDFMLLGLFSSISEQYGEQNSEYSEEETEEQEEQEEGEEIEAGEEEEEEEEEEISDEAEGEEENKDEYFEWRAAVEAPLKAFIRLPELPKREYFKDWYNPVTQILNALRLAFPYKEEIEYLEGLVGKIFNHIPQEELGRIFLQKTYWSNQQRTWRDVPLVDVIYRQYTSWANGMTDAQFTQYWQYAHWYAHTLPAEFEGQENYILPLNAYARAYKLELINRDTLLWRIMRPEGIQEVTAPPAHENVYDIRREYPFLNEFVEPCRNRILEIELKRGDTPTAVTDLANALQQVHGIDNFVKILVGLGKDTLHRGYSWSLANSKQIVLSRLLKNSHPAPNETQEDFNQKITASKISEKRLVEAATYAPQWIGLVANFLGWGDMPSAVWWLHAHTNAYHSAETETEIAKYSKVEMQDFSDGAVDIDWFQSVYASLGAERWKLLYDSAKYISDGNGHTRAKLYADVMLGNISLEEIAKRVSEKRNQDYLRVYGLAALDKKNPDSDVLQRYQYLQKFKKESKQFGSQKQTSEALAVRISMDNLARTAGFSDPMRLTWAMETEEAIQIVSNAKALNYNDVTISLDIDEDGHSSIICRKGEKLLKSIPDAVKKEPAIVELKEFNTTLQNQYKRTRKSLEDAMINGDAFKISEIENLMKHPVVSPMLRKLVLKSGDNLGFWQEGKLVTPDGKTNLPADTLQIAHCCDLFAGKDWSSYQRHCFENQIKQPFKQIFRELYVPTEDELKEKSVSRRYAGHQVQPKKTVALLKSQGWTVNYDEGLQKVFHREGFVAKIFAMADWFSPSDVESPTLETAEFIDRKTFKSIAFAEMNPRIFSEVMRDLDLVVSVAHVGEVDPEASQSSIELRHAIVGETLRLFKISNVEIKGTHALIKGKLGDYSVHLGSAVAHRVAGSSLSILPVHSQHRGKFFLPFLDEDPKTAELISKIILLAKDNEIQDPTILRQL